MIKKTNFKGSNAICLENDAIKATIFPEHGGKVASFYSKTKDFELLFQNKSQEYKKAYLGSNFGEFDAAGFDDAFPTIDRENVEILKNTIEYPDHGEVWTMDFNSKIEGQTLTLSQNSAILPYNFKKTLSIKDNGLNIFYEIKNTGKIDFPCFWAMHCLINCEPDMQLIFPKGTKEVLNVTQSRMLGKEGTVHAFPKTKLTSGEEFSLDRILPKDANNCEKYYVNGKVCEGVCGAYYPEHDVKFKVTFPKEKLPYLGFWVTEGAFRGDYNCAMEPTNAFYDSISKAKRNNKIYILKSGETFKFNITLELI